MASVSEEVCSAYSFPLTLNPGIPGGPGGPGGQMAGHC